jgi:hypothetical protein
MMSGKSLTYEQSTPSRSDERAKIANFTLVEYMAYFAEGEAEVQWAERAAAIAVAVGKGVN